MSYPAPISGCTTSGLCNLTLGEASPMFQYTPLRDGPADAGWNASYTGSTVYKLGVAGIGTPYRNTSFDQAAFQLSFQGTAIYLCLAMSTGATYTLTVDGQQYNTTGAPTDPACSSKEGVQLVAFADSLSPDSPLGGHSVEFAARFPDPGLSLSFYGAVLTLNVAPSGYIISDPVLVDDTDPGWTYDGDDWVHVYNVPSEYNNTHTYNSDYNSASDATYTVPIGAAALILMGTPDVNTYAYSIRLDGIQAVFNSTNLFSQDREVLFFANGLDSKKTHIIEVINFDANAQGLTVTQCINLDALFILNSTSPEPQATTTTGLSPPSLPATPFVSPPATNPITTPPSQNGGQTSGGALAGIVVGSLSGLLLLVLLFWLFRRRLSRMRDTASDCVSIVPPDFLEARPYIMDQDQGASNAAGAYQPGALKKEVASSLGVALVTSTASKRSPLIITNPQSDSGLQSPKSHDAPLEPMLEQASTLDLVQVLNRRRHNEQIGNLEEPPDYPQSRRPSRLRCA